MKNPINLKTQIITIDHDKINQDKINYDHNNRPLLYKLLNEQQ